MLARLSSPHLNRQLAAGAPSWQTPRHAARALQLTACRAREDTARSLERLVALSAMPPSRMMAVSVCRGEIQRATRQLLDTARRLRDPAPVHSRGMAMLAELLSDGRSPCYMTGPLGQLERALDVASTCLEVQD